MSTPSSQEVDLAEQVQELLEQFKRALGVVRSHPQTKELERTIAKAVGELNSQIDSAMKNARDDAHLKQVESQLKQAAHSIQDSGATEDITNGLAKGVRALNEQLRKAIDEAEKGTRKD